MNFRESIWGTAAVGSLFTIGLCSAARAEGPGIRNGDLVIHPEAEAGAGVDNNVFYEDSSESPINATVTRFGLGVGLENRHPNKIGLSLDADSRFRFLFADADADTKRAIEARNGFDVASADATVAILPRNPFTFELTAAANYKDRPAFEDSTDGYQRLEFKPGFDLRFRPGTNPDSRPFELRLGYRAQLVRLLDCESIGICSADKTGHELRFLTSWKFLPKTAVSFDARWTAIDYDKAGSAPLAAGAAAAEQNRDAMPLELAVGLKGLVTRRLSVTLRLGYENSFNDAGEGYNGLIATTELQYAIEPSLKVTLGYNRDARDNSYSNFYVLNQAYTEAELYFFGRWNLGGRFGFDHYAFSETSGDAVVEPREDPVLTYGVHGGYNPMEWLAVRLSFEGENNQTDFAIVDGNPSAYHRTLALLSVEAKY